MPHFFFNLCSPGAIETDTDGLQFESLDAAYLEAYRAALSISLELLHARVDPNAHRFEIRDAEGTLLLDLPFSEALRPTPSARPKRLPSAIAVSETFQRTEQLRGDIIAQVNRARLMVAAARETMRRSSEQSSFI